MRHGSLIVRLLFRVGLLTIGGGGEGSSIEMPLPLLICVMTEVTMMGGGIADWLNWCTRNWEVITAKEIFPTLVVSVIQESTKIAEISETFKLKANLFRAINGAKTDVHTPSQGLSDIQKDLNMEIWTKTFKKGQQMNFDKITQFISDELSLA
uniref:Uncharacterized protein n=1 Tax=Cannabis sativa TaxID=3483 RepID=A0A803PBT7_CANSA